MAQTVFYPDLDAFCRKHLVKAPGRPDPSPVEFIADMARQQTTLFENLLLFDKISLRVTGESIPIATLLSLIGQKGFESLIEQGAIEFVLWNQNILHFVNTIPGVDALCYGKFDTPEYNDPEKSIDAGLKWMRDAPTGRRRRNLVRRLTPLFSTPPKNLSERSVNAVNQALRSGGMEHYGIPKASGPAIDSLTPIQRQIASKSAEDFAEYEFLLTNNMTSFSDYRYFSPFWASVERFRTMNRTVKGFSALSTIEGMPDLRALFHEIANPLQRVAEIRSTHNAVRFRKWLETTAGASPDADMVKSYLDAISNRKGLLDSSPRKFIKAVAMAAVGVGVGSVAASYAGAYVGGAVGAAATMVVPAAEKLAEFVTDTGVGLFDSLLLERITKGWSPRMFFDELSRLQKMTEQRADAQ